MDQNSSLQNTPQGFPKVDKKGVFLYIGLTFSLSWLLDLVIYLRGGLGMPGAVNVVQLQMMMPALSAILLGLFYSRQSPIYRFRPAGRGRWFFYSFFLFALILAFASLGTLLAPDKMPAFAAQVPLLVSFLGLIVLIVVSIAAGRKAIARVWLAWGNWRYWLLFGVGFTVYYILQAALNAVTGLGTSEFGAIPSLPVASTGMYLTIGLAQILQGSILGIFLGFGEEYGWRGYLQNELFKMGRVRGVLVLGLIWGAWHWPVILMGHNYPDHPLLGAVLFLGYTTCLGIVLSYALLKSGSIILAAFLHALNNTALFVIQFLGFKPFDTVFSFGLGIYGVATMAIIALLLLIDPIWRKKGSGLPQVEATPGAQAFTRVSG